MKRLLIATAFGVVAGLLCVAIGTILAGQITPRYFAWALLNRTLLGFVIGISGLRMHWAWHGSVLGVIVGSLFAYSLYLLASPAWMVPAVMAGSAVFGLMIEFFTTVVFRQPQQALAAAPRTEVKARIAA